MPCYQASSDGRGQQSIETSFNPSLQPFKIVILCHFQSMFIILHIEPIKSMDWDIVPLVLS